MYLRVFLSTLVLRCSSRPTLFRNPVLRLTLASPAIRQNSCVNVLGPRISSMSSVVSGLSIALNDWLYSKEPHVTIYSSMRQILLLSISMELLLLRNYSPLWPILLAFESTEREARCTSATRPSQAIIITSSISSAAEQLISKNKCLGISK
ncbi:hypothetical protein BT63DRAFT_73446 [Microthyrium microscopicum]|uniref:Uncharacterized protein n=1 Tax=Microthyrium microscopicum TaxID=703497 RepID=A0A6A6U275_9PEZI|nr:hypothetical protein BT63DRAFT_73446 [Microthyrium microscopicum]